MKRRNYRAAVTMMPDGEQHLSQTKYTHNSALEAGKAVLRDMGKGAWTIDAWDTESLHLINDSNPSLTATITVREVHND